MLQSVDTSCARGQGVHGYRKNDNEPLTRRAGEPIGERFIAVRYNVST